MTTRVSIHLYRRHPEVLAASCGEPRRIDHERLGPSFETPRKRAAPQDDGRDCCIRAHRDDQHFTRFCSRSTAALTPPEARGYFRVTSPSAAQAASFSFRAASDWPTRRKES